MTRKWIAAALGLLLLADVANAAEITINQPPPTSLLGQNNTWPGVQTFNNAVLIGSTITGVSLATVIGQPNTWTGVQTFNAGLLGTNNQTLGVGTGIGTKLNANATGSGALAASFTGFWLPTSLTGTGSISAGELGGLQADANAGAVSVPLLHPFESFASSSGGTVASADGILHILTNTGGTFTEYNGQIVSINNNSGTISTVNDVKCVAPAVGTVATHFCLRGSSTKGNIKIAGNYANNLGDLAPIASPGCTSTNFMHAGIYPGDRSNASAVDLSIKTYWSIWNNLCGRAALADVSIYINSAVAAATCTMNIFETFIGAPTGSKLWSADAVFSAAATGLQTVNFTTLLGAPWTPPDYGTYAIGIFCSSASVAIRTSVDAGAVAMTGTATINGNQTTPVTNAISFAGTPVFNTLSGSLSAVPFTYPDVAFRLN